MTGVPTNFSNKLKDVLEKVLNRVERKLSIGLRQASESLVKTYSVIGNLQKTFSSSEGLQKRALASNTNLTKVLEFNSLQLKNLRGGLLENAEELFQNFSEGIRESTDSQNLLINRMKLTGQSTDLLREVSKSMLELTGGNIDSVDNLAKINLRVSRQNVISNEKLIESLNDLKGVMEIPALTGDSDLIANMNQLLTGALKGLGGQDITKSLSLLFGSGDQDLATNLMLGTKDIVSRLEGLTSPDEQFSELKNIISEAKDYIKENLVVAKGDFARNKTRQILDQVGNTDQLLALVRVGDLLEKTDKTTGKMTVKEDEYYLTQDNLVKESLKFYEYSAIYYEDALRALNSIAGGLGGGLAGLSAGLGVGGLIRVMGGSGAILKWLGPIGAIAGTLIPMIASQFSGSKISDPNSKKALEEARKSRENLDDINKKLNPPEDQKKDNSSAMYLQMASNNLYEIASMTLKDRKADKQIQELEEANSNLRRVVRELSAKGGFR